MSPLDAAPSQTQPARDSGPGGPRPVIGLEVHARLATRTKLFCGCESGSGGTPNSRICPICTGFPGTLPFPNREAIRLAARAALLLGAELQPLSRWSRKHYFYPDLPKGYQITQHERPLARGGSVRFSDEEGSWRRVDLRGLHVEEDAGKLVHEGLGEGVSGVDFNRCGIPLIEIVSEPVLESPAEASRFLEQLRATLRAGGVSDANMEDGSLRCDANVSLSIPGDRSGERVEIKNLNSFRFVRAALHHEIERQGALVARGGRVARETRLWDERAGVTRPMRAKEELRDYRYLDEPDLPALALDEKLLREAKEALPKPPDALEHALRGTGLRPESARRVALEPATMRFFEAARAAGASANSLETWMLVEAAGRLSTRGETWESTELQPGRLAELIALVHEGRVTATQGKSMLERLFEGDISPRELAESEGIDALADEGALRELARTVLAAFPEQVSSYREGKHALLGFFVGRLLDASGGRADARRAREVLERALEHDA